MINISSATLVEYSADLIFNIILDVSSYPEFLDRCRGVEVVSTSKDSMVIDMSLDIYNLHRFYRSEVKFCKEKGHILFRSIDSNVFECMRGRFDITSKGKNKTEVKVSIDFRFKSMIINAAARLAKSKVLRYTHDKFTNRARQLS